MSAFSVEFAGKAREIVTDIAFASALSENESQSAPVVCKAFWDTGANVSAISPKVVSSLGLSSINRYEVYAPNGPYMASVYAVDVMLPNRMVVKGVAVTEADLKDCDALIGMDIIALGDLMISNRDNTRFTFRIPAEGDFNASL